MGGFENYFLAVESIDLYFLFVSLLLFCNRFFCILIVPCNLVCSIYIYIYISLSLARNG